MLCVIHGPTIGRRWEASAARRQLHHAAATAGLRRWFAPQQLRHGHAVEMTHEGVPLVVIQRQLGHANLGTVGMQRQLDRDVAFLECALELGDVECRCAGCAQRGWLSRPL